MGRPLVLIVEDNPLTQETLEQGLTKRGFEAIVCSTAEDALERLKSGLQVPIIILDLKLPGMNGADFSRIIKTDDRWNSISIIPLTSLATSPLEPADPLFQDILFTRSHAPSNSPYHPILSKGDNEAIAYFPSHLIPALVRALHHQQIQLPEGLIAESRKVLDAMQNNGMGQEA